MIMQVQGQHFHNPENECLLKRLHPSHISCITPVLILLFNITFFTFHASEDKLLPLSSAILGLAAKLGSSISYHKIHPVGASHNDNVAPSPITGMFMIAPVLGTSLGFS